MPAASAAMLSTAQAARDTMCDATVEGFAGYTALDLSATSCSPSAQPDLAEKCDVLDVSEDIMALCRIAGVKSPLDHPEVALLAARGVGYTEAFARLRIGSIPETPCGPARAVTHRPSLAWGNELKRGAPTNEKSIRGGSNPKRSHYDELFGEELSVTSFPPLQANAVKTKRRQCRKISDVQLVPGGVSHPETCCAAARPVRDRQPLAEGIRHGKNEGRAWRVPPPPTLSEWISRATQRVP